MTGSAGNFSAAGSSASHACEQSAVAHSTQGVGAVAASREDSPGADFKFLFRISARRATAFVRANRPAHLKHVECC